MGSSLNCGEHYEVVYIPNCGEGSKVELESLDFCPVLTLKPGAKWAKVRKI